MDARRPILADTLHPLGTSGKYLRLCVTLATAWEGLANVTALGGMPSCKFSSAASTLSLPMHMDAPCVDYSI